MWHDCDILNNMYKPQFTITPEITNHIAHIEAVKQKIERSRILPEQEIALRYRAAIESVHSSTSIEGNPLDEKQVEAALAGQLNAWERRVIEVVNYKKAWDWIEKRKKKSNISLKDILKLHTLVADQLLPKEKVGRIRPGPVYVVDISAGKEIVKYTGPQSGDVQKLLEELFVWLNSQQTILHPVLLVGILHYAFVSIHPFSDGNGRVTRLFVKLILHMLGYDFRGSLALDTYYWQNTGAYYQALNQAPTYADQRKADMTSWLRYFVEGFYRVVKDLERTVDLVRVRHSHEVIRLSGDELQILDYIQQFGQVSLKEVLDIVQVPQRTAQRRLQKLVERGLLQVVGQGKNTSYVLKKKH